MLVSIALAAALSGETPRPSELVRFERTFSPILIKETVSLTAVADGVAKRKPRYQIHYERRNLSSTTDSLWLDGERCPGIVKMLPALLKVQKPRSGSGPHRSDGTSYSLTISTPPTGEKRMSSSDPGSQLVVRARAAFDAIEACRSDKSAS